MKVAATNCRYSIVDFAFYSFDLEPDSYFAGTKHFYF